MSDNKVIIRTLSNVEVFPTYELFLKKQNSTSFFHTILFYNSLIKTHGIKPVSVVLLDASHNVRAAAIGELTDEIRFLPYLTRRLIFYAQPLYETDNDLKTLLKQLNTKRNGLFTQIRSFKGFSNQEIVVYNQFGFKITDHLNAYINLKGESEESILANFRKDKHKGIRKALDKYSLTVKEFEDISFSVNTFYQIQKKLYNKKRHSLKSREFFFHLINESEDHVRITFALFNETPIAAQLYIIYNSTITALYTATLPNHLDKHAGDLLVWYLIQKGLNEKLHVFDFGGGGNPLKSYSPRVYKERFGTSFQNVGRLTKQNSCLYKLAISVYNKVLKSK